MTKLCVNCKYAKMGLHPKFPMEFMCTHPKNLQTDLVTGTKSYITNCSGQRTNNLPPEAYCGPEGKWYEDKGSPGKEIEVEIKS